MLTALDDFAEDDGLAPRDEQDCRSVYTDLYRRWRGDKEEAAVINDDLIFEVELIKRVDIDIDCILMLVQKYHDSHCAARRFLRYARGAMPKVRLNASEKAP